MREKVGIHWIRSFVRGDSLLVEYHASVCCIIISPGNRNGLSGWMLGLYVVYTHSSHTAVMSSVLFQHVCVYQKQNKVAPTPSMYNDHETACMEGVSFTEL